MPERVTKDQDEFIEFRIPESISWVNLKPAITSHFSGTIPDKLEPHLIEWAVIRGQAKDRLITKEQFDKVMRGYSVEHEEYFENDLFSGAIRIITSRLPVAA